MAPNTLSIKEAFGFGWRTFKSRIWFFVGVTAAVTVLEMGVGALQDALGGVLGVVVSLLLSTLITVGVINVFLLAHEDAKRPQFKDLWNPAPFWRYLGVSIILFALLLLGFVLLIVPGVILSLMLFLAPYLVVDKGMNPIAALKESCRRTKGNRWKLFLLMLSVLGITLLGIIPLFLGLLITTPIAALASVHAYRKLTEVPVVAQ